LFYVSLFFFFSKTKQKRYSIFWAVKLVTNIGGKEPGPETDAER